MSDNGEKTKSVVLVNYHEIMDKIFVAAEQTDEAPERIAVFTHPNPDPDGMASALGLKWLLANKYGIEVDFITFGESTRKQNTTMINLLGIVMSDWGAVKETFNETYERAIVVDALPDRLPPEAAKKVKLVIDHHDVNLTSAQRKKYDLVMIERVGACCSLIYRLMSECGCLPGDKSIEQHPSAGDAQLVATAMTAGIMIDTRQFMSLSVNKLDLEAYTYFFGLADSKLARKIDKFKESRYLFELRGELIKEENHVIENTTYIGSAGYLPAGRTDVLPQLADEFIRMEGVTTAIVFAIVENDLVVKMRSEDESLVVNTFLQKLFGEKNAGAKAGEGGGAIPLGLLGIDSPTDELKAKIYDTIKSVIMHLLSREVKNE